MAKTIEDFIIPVAVLTGSDWTSRDNQIKTCFFMAEALFAEYLHRKEHNVIWQGVKPDKEYYGG